MTAHIDPASAEFEKLPRSEQANILRYQFGWKVAALAEEYSVTERTVRVWTIPGKKEKEAARKAAYFQTERGKRVRAEHARSYKARQRASRASRQQEAA